jgi:hypothetical protein
MLCHTLRKVFSAIPRALSAPCLQFHKAIIMIEDIMLHGAVTSFNTL